MKNLQQMPCSIGAAILNQTMCHLQGDLFQYRRSCAVEFKLKINLANVYRKPTVWKALDRGKQLWSIEDAWEYYLLRETSDAVIRDKINVHTTPWQSKEAEEVIWELPRAPGQYNNSAWVVIMEKYCCRWWVSERFLISGRVQIHWGECKGRTWLSSMDENNRQAGYLFEHVVTNWSHMCGVPFLHYQEKNMKKREN